jgi:hypothetical protein
MAIKVETDVSEQRLIGLKWRERAGTATNSNSNDPLIDRQINLD